MDSFFNNDCIHNDPGDSNDGSHYGHSIHVMVIDDNPDVLSCIGNLLNANGFHNTTFTNPLEAIKACKVEKYDIIVTDFQMPELTGIDAIRTIRNFNAGIRTVIISGRSDIAELITPEDNIDAIFPKPLVMGSFMNMLSRIEHDILNIHS